MLAPALDQLNLYRDPDFGARRMRSATACGSCLTAPFHLRSSLGRTISLSAYRVVRKRRLDDGRP
jgi:hypothetical protein